MPAPSSIGVLFGGPSPEHDVSVLTGLQASRALRQSGRVREVHGIYWSKRGAFFAVEGDLEAKAFADAAPGGARPLDLVLGSPGGFVGRPGRLGRRGEPLALDAVIVCCHGGAGEDGSLQGALDLAGVAYSGPGVRAAALGMDKLASGAVLASAGLPVLGRRLLEATTKDVGFAGPYIVKPRFGGSSIGIEVVEDLETARSRLAANVHLRQGAVVEPYRADLYDLQIALLTYPELRLSAIERPLRRSGGSEILDYADKYVGGEGMHAAPRELPAAIDEALESHLRELSVAVATLFGARGAWRVDFLSDGRELFVNEVNTVPGSLSRHLFVDPPIAFDELLVALATEAVERPAAVVSTAGADGRLLREAATISAKLA